MSYQWGSQETVKRIVAELEMRGYLVWASIPPENLRWLPFSPTRVLSWFDLNNM